MAFGTRQYLMGAASGIMKTSDKWQSIIGGACFPLSGNVPGLINCEERVSWKSVNQGNSELSGDVQCSTRAAPFSGETREDRELRQRLADAVCAGCREDTGRVFAGSALVRPRASHRGRRGRKGSGRGGGGRGDTLPPRAGTGAALPPAFAD